MTRRHRTHDVIVIGAGAAGLTAAGGCARLGLRVALIERDRMGGECLNTGCVPSKALIATSRRAQAIRTADALGLAPAEPEVDFARVRAHVRAAIAAIAPYDSEERFRAWGVEVIRGEARVLDAGSVSVAGRRLQAPRIVLAVGSRPSLPPVEGLADVPYLTNETLWDRLDRLPRRLVVLGGGSVGMEMAQAFRRLGSAVTVIEAARPFPRDDPEAAAVVLDRLAAEGVAVLPGTRAVRVVPTGADGLRVETDKGTVVEGSHLLVAVGRRAAVDGLGLEAAGVAVDPGGIRVDARRRTTNRRILAIGDCRDGPRFTHSAGYEGTVAVMNVALGIPAAVDDAALPWVSFTDPELAQVGLTEAAARERHGQVRVHRETFAENDRAVAEGDTAGFVKVVTARHGRRVVGATLVGTGAGEMVLPWSLAIRGKASLWSISGAVVPYPTRSELSKAVAFSAYEARVFGPSARRWAGLLARLRR